MYPFEKWHDQRKRPHILMLLVESFLMTLLATLVAWLVFPSATGLIAVFFVTFGMQGSFLILLECNRRDIWDEQAAPATANLRLTGAIVVIFIGVFFSFLTIALILPPEQSTRLFASQFELSPLKAADLTRIHFGEFGNLFSHNFYILCLCFFISWMYRQGGAMLILSWNASVWAVSYVSLSQVSMAKGGSSLLSTVSAVAIGISPHLVLEATAYVITAMSGIFLAKGIEKYSLRDPSFQRVVRACLVLTAVGVAVLALGCWIESMWPKYWLRHML